MNREFEASVPRAGGAAAAGGHTTHSSDGPATRTCRIVPCASTGRPWCLSIGRRLKECRLLCLRCKTRCFARRHAARSDSVEERAVPLTFEPHMGVGVRHSTHSSPSVAAQIEATVTFSTTSP